jgi:hypothetical protein
MGHLPVVTRNVFITDLQWHLSTILGSFMVGQRDAIGTSKIFRQGAEAKSFFAQGGTGHD